MIYDRVVQEFLSERLAIVTRLLMVRDKLLVDEQLEGLRTCLDTVRSHCILVLELGHAH